jgi:protease-4
MTGLPPYSSLPPAAASGPGTPPDPGARRRRRGSVLPLILLLVLLCIPIVLAVVLLLGQAAPAVGEGTWLRVVLGSPFPEARPEGVGWRAALQADVLSAQDLAIALRRAVDDRRVCGVLVCPDGFDGGWAQAQEIVGQLQAVRDAGKPVWAYVQSPSPAGYYIASCAERIALPPEGGLYILGLEARLTHLKGTLDKLGIQADFVAVGEYKSAPEQLTRDSASDPSRQQVSEYLDDVYEAWLQSMAQGRGLSLDRMEELVDRGYFDAHTALAEGLVDTLLDETQLWEHLQPDRDEPRLVEPLDYVRSPSRAPALDRRGRLALIYATGEVGLGDSGEGGLSGNVMGSDTIVKRLRRAADDDRVKAVVLRVDSPGGSALASDIIWQEIQRLQERKPMVVSMGDLAASGGYYISMSADQILADPLTLTGSIGVFLGKMDVAGLYKKIGVSVEVLRRGENAGAFSELAPFTPKQREDLQHNLADFYQRFLQKVAQGRSLEVEKVDEVARGRVWSGERALEAGLVDSLGTLRDALRVAKQLAGLPPDARVPVDTYQEQPGVFERAVANFLRNASAWTRAEDAVLPVELRATLQRLRGLALAMDGSPQFRLPWTLRIE